MGRKLCGRLKRRLLSGDLQKLNDYLLDNKGDLRFEIRTNGDAFVYYRKGKALEVRGQKVDKKYGNVPDCALSITNPSIYFNAMRNVIDQWVEKNHRPEFDTQQKVAIVNSTNSCDYIIVDMEYSFSLAFIPKDDRPKSVVFDLIGIEKSSGRLCVFEVKTGVSALYGKSGVNRHIEDFEYYFNSEYSKQFKENICNDVLSILVDKMELNYMDEVVLPHNFKELEPELIFVFESQSNGDIDVIRNMVDGKYKIIEVGKHNGYNLCK